VKPLKIAVTGGIGSGKSLFCSFLAEAGYPVLSADEISKSLLQQNPRLREQIISAFGEKSYLNGNLNRAYLAAEVFSNPENVKKINAIVHPVVISESANLMNEMTGQHALVFYESALIFEAAMTSLFDKIVVVQAGEQMRVQRIIARDNTTESRVLERLSKQLPDSEKANKADFVILNQGSVQDLRNKAEVLVENLLDISRQMS
jgi:dephospho-CoA kinase